MFVWALLYTRLVYSVSSFWEIGRVRRISYHLAVFLMC